MLKTASVQFKNPKYNYETSVNGNLSDKEIIDCFEGTEFNLGGIRYDHKNDCEIEVDDLQTCIKCEVL